MGKLKFSVKFILTIILIGLGEKLDVQIPIEESQKPDFSTENRFHIYMKKVFNISKITIETIFRSGKMLMTLINRDSDASHLRKSRNHNFASLSSGAKVISSDGIISPSSALSKDKDKYLSFRCRGDNVKASMVISLEEDAFIDVLKFHFLESYNNFIKDFEVYLSISGASESWILVGVYKAQNNKHYQIFNLKDPKLARHLKIIFKTAYSSYNHYCTITQIEVNGQTYLSYTSQKTAKRLNDELTKPINNNYEQIDEEIVKKEMAKLENPQNQSIVGDIKTQLALAVQMDRERKEYLKNMTCPKFQDLYHYAKQMCPLNYYSLNHLFKIITKEGPLESYYEMLNLKINVIK